MSREPFVCNGHDGLTHDELRKHHARQCKDDTTRDAANKHARNIYEARKANKPGAETPEPAAATEYVDHFKMPAEPITQPTAPLDVLVTTALNNNLGPAIERIHPVATAKPAPRSPSVNRPSHGAARRLRGLTNLGYTPKELATHSGLSVDSIWWLLIAPPTTIKNETHAVIDRAFKSLRIQLKTAMIDSPEVRNAARARGLAELNNWPGAYDWEDIDNVLAIPASTRGRSGGDVEKLARAVADAALEDIITPPPAPVVVAPAAIDTTELDRLRAANKQLIKENARQADTISTLQSDARTNRHDYNNLHELKNLLAEERDEIKAANINLHEQLTDAKFNKPAGPLGYAGTVELDATLSDIPDAFTIEFEPSAAGGFTLTLPTALLTR